MTLKKKAGLHHQIRFMSGWASIITFCHVCIYEIMSSYEMQNRILAIGASQNKDIRLGENSVRYNSRQNLIQKPYELEKRLLN